MNSSDVRPLPLNLIRSFAILFIGGAALWFSVIQTASIVYASRDAELALKLWPTAAAKTALAAELATHVAEPKDVRRALALAQDALRDAPSNAVAVRSVALVYDQQGSETLARRYAEYAEKLSRRDIPLELWRIEDSVRQGNIVAAIAHYDHALRASSEIRRVLFPVLSNAANDVRVAAALGDRLAARPNWWTDFTDPYFAHGEDARAMATIIQHMRLKPDTAENQARIAIALRRMVELGRANIALSVFQSITKTRANSAPAVIDGEFELERNLLPFDWVLSADPDHSGIKEHRDGAAGQRALTLIGGAHGEVARQLISLKPGQHSLSARVGEVDVDLLAPPSIRVVCYSHDNQIAGSMYLPKTEAPIAIKLPLSVPKQNCDFQWLVIISSSAIDVPKNYPWVDSIKIE